MDPKAEKIHIMGCPAARRALRQNNPHVMWCLNHIARLFDNDIKFSDARKPGFKSPGVVYLINDDDPFDTTVSKFSVTTMRSKFYNNEVVMLISKFRQQPPASEFDLMLTRSKPVPLI